MVYRRSGIIAPRVAGFSRIRIVEGKDISLDLTAIIPVIDHLNPIPSPMPEGAAGNFVGVYRYAAATKAEKLGAAVVVSRVAVNS